MALTESNEKPPLALLEGRFVEGAGFPHRMGASARPDATSWAILALEAAGSASGVAEKAQRLLVKAQGDDGRVCVRPQDPDAYWPTALAALAWSGAHEYDEPRNKAIRFLLESSLVGVFEGTQAGESHDVTIQGWPWTVRAHPWVEPTAYVLLALRARGYGTHRRAADAVRLLVDRQLPAGGWNVGTTVTFGKQMWPTPEATGLALQALAGLVPKPHVEKSIAYLRSQLPALNAPMSVGWAILALHAWQETIDRPQERIREVLARQERLGVFDTFSLSLLLLAWYCPAGLVRFLEDRQQAPK
ncbi:MAG: terpene cyclase/mutase family protein [Planctomycetes bacterium]|jgi:hypothetical protein|nr:terpene cyclase/mutase family protein [Planctomycetota bacterium]